MDTTQEHGKGTLLQGYSPWRAILLAVAGDLTRRGEQTLLSVTQLLAVASGWRANIALCHV